jgi:hypothetical protein
VSDLPAPLRTFREDLGVPAVTTHSFRKTVATLIDDEGLPGSELTAWATRMSR